MPIMPTLTPRWNRRAASPELVKIAVPLPRGLELTSLNASSTSSTRTTESTGPKISSRYTSIVGVTLSMTVGPTMRSWACRVHLARGVAAAADLDRTSPLVHGIHDPLRRRADGDGRRDRHA